MALLEGPKKHPSVSEAPQPQAPQRHSKADLGTDLPRNLWSGLHLLVLRRVAPEAFARSFDQLLLLLVFNVAVWVVLEFLSADPDTVLGLDAFYGLGCYVLIGLFACGLIARMQSAEANTRALLIPVLSVAPFVLVVFWVGADIASRSERWATVLLIVGLIYLAALGLRILHAAYGSVRLAPGLTAVLVFVGTPVLLAALDLDTRLWVSGNGDEGDSDDSVTEPLLYEQPARIGEAVSHVAAAPASGRPAVYFVGFAGDGDEGIFKREALFAQQVFAAHFGSGPRSVELINDDQNRDTYPIATVTGLEQTLKLLASRMDTSRDVLVLTLTSHGSQDGLEVENGDLPLLQLEPDDLRDALDESGIQWRVVVVSACYSGVFVKALKNDRTLIITAADADHSSFGCDDDRELTYFGEAFFKDSVPSTDTLEQAFKKAAGLIDARETAEHKIHSNPQLWMGPLMRQKLATLEHAHGSLVVSAGTRR